MICDVETTSDISDVELISDISDVRSTFLKKTIKKGLVSFSLWRDDILLSPSTIYTFSDIQKIDYFSNIRDGILSFIYPNIEKKVRGLFVYPPSLKKIKKQK